ncbi:hypothetical protein PHMEG_00039728, partial [Phytophthora megakarya]
VGTDALTIQFHGCWVSDAFKFYTRLCKESVAKLSSDMVAGSRRIRRCVSRGNSMTNSGGTAFLVPYRIELMVIA